MNVLQFLEEGKAIEILENTGVNKKWGQAQEVPLNQLVSSPWVRHVYRKPAKSGAEIAPRIEKPEGAWPVRFDRAY